MTFQVGDVVEEIKWPSPNYPLYEVIYVDRAGGVKVKDHKTGKVINGNFSPLIFRIVKPRFQKKISDYKSWL